MYELISKEKFFFFQRKRSHALSKYDLEMEYFTKYSLSLFLSKYTERAIEKRFFNSKEFELPLFEEIINCLEKSKYLKDPVINMLCLQLRLCLRDDDESYFKLKNFYTKRKKNR